jgi:hypothetical protein
MSAPERNSMRRPSDKVSSPYAPPQTAVVGEDEASRQAWGEAAATGWKVFWLMALVAGFLFLTLSGVIERGMELALPMALVVHGRFTYLLLPLLAPALTIAGFRYRRHVPVDPRRLVWLLQSMLFAFAVLAVLITWLVESFT